MKFSDLLNNEHIPLEKRVKHLEKEASFVREYVLKNDGWKIACIALSVLSLMFSILALLK